MPLQFAAGNAQIARLLGAAGQQQGVMLAAQIFDSDIDAHVRAGPEAHPFGASSAPNGGR